MLGHVLCLLARGNAKSQRVYASPIHCLCAAPSVPYRGMLARPRSFQVVKSYCGHGIGDLFHCAPNVPHYAHNKAVGIMKEGHVFTIEPMINAGSWRDRTWPDGWTAVTEDGKRSAQFEHTLVVTRDGCEVLTRRLEGSPPLWWEMQ